MLCDSKTSGWDADKRAREDRVSPGLAATYRAIQAFYQTLEKFLNSSKRFSTADDRDYGRPGVGLNAFASFWCSIKVAIKYRVTIAPAFSLPALWFSSFHNNVFT